MDGLTGCSGRWSYRRCICRSNLLKEFLHVDRPPWRHSSGRCIICGEWFSAWVCCTRTVILIEYGLPKPSCIAPDVIAATWCPMCDGQATQVVLVNGVACICTTVEA